MLRLGGRILDRCMVVGCF